MSTVTGRERNPDGVLLRHVIELLRRYAQVAHSHQPRRASRAQARGQGPPRSRVLHRSAPLTRAATTARARIARPNAAANLEGGAGAIASVALTPALGGFNGANGSADRRQL